jgi:SH3-like domain-containing protein
MFGTRAVRHCFVIASLCLAGLPGWVAAEMVSIRNDQVNMRAGPSTSSKALWELKKGYPLRVLSRKGNWVRVQDFENDRGWIYAKLTGKTPYHIVKSRTANIRSGPGTKFKVIGQASNGDLLRTRSKRSTWVQVQAEDGVKGWVSRSLLWGW